MTISLECLPCHLSSKQMTSEMLSLMEVFHPSGAGLFIIARKVTVCACPGALAISVFFLWTCLEMLEIMLIEAPY